MDKIKIFILYTCFMQVLCVKIKLKEETDISADFSAENVNNQDDNRMDSVLYKTIRKYDCLKNNIEGSHILVYGRKRWTFPRQNISLSLTYPPENSKKGEFNNYLITGFEVILFMDGGKSEGYISEGGIMNSSIRLTFECGDVTTVGYEFWLYGVTQTTHNTLKPSVTFYDMC